ncbi:MAG: T9SS type A sorting domain-containing protein [Flavobacteriales bacterium]|nr:T9SS type A sorting domain-containing protein [Flavobacteriales bacterium]
MKKNLLFLTLLFIFISLKSQNFVLDETFGNNGVATISGESDYVVIESKIQPGGKILIAGHRINGINRFENFICRFNSNGIIDTTFGLNGYYILNHVNEDDNGPSFYLLSDGSIIIVSNVSDSKLTKLTSNGILDSSFALGGILSFSNYEISDYGKNNSLILNDNTILLLGNSLYSSNTKLVKVNLNDGVIDSNFGTNGELEISIPNNQIDEIINNSNNYYYFITSEDSITKKIQHLVRFDSNFNLDSSFNITLSDILSSHFIFHNILITENEILDYSAETDEEDNLFEITNLKKYNLNGTLDNSFGTDGIIQFNNQYFSTPYKNNNKIYLYGYKNESNDFNSLISRYNLDGSIDTTFNSIGFYIEDTNDIKEFASNLNINEEGSIIIAGGYKDGIANKIYLAKYIEETLSSEEIKVNQLSFKNPISDKLEINSEKEIKSLELFNLEGKLIISSKTNTLDTSFINKGIYVVKVTFKDGESRIEKIIKI